MPAYSDKPLWNKLGLTPGSRAVVKNTTERSLPDILAEAPFTLAPKADFFPGMNFVHLFVDHRAELARQIPLAQAVLDPAGMLWVSWPKKSAKTDTDITEDTIRDVVLPLGLVDVKVCSVTDELWSGLKIVVRRENRPRGATSA